MGWNEEDWNEEMEEKATNLVADLGDYVNNFSYETQAKLFTEQLGRKHPTLQANVIRMLINVIKLYPDTKWVDDRNKGAIKACETIKHFIDTTDEWLYIPTI